MTGPKVNINLLPATGVGLGAANPAAVATGNPAAVGGLKPDRFVEASAARKGDQARQLATPPAGPVRAPLQEPERKIITIGVPRPPESEDKYPVHLEPYQAELVHLLEGQVVDWGIKMLEVLQVHATTTGDKACVFVLDTGGAYDHPDLQDNLLPEYAKNFSDSKGMEDNHGHSTHCAGIACGNNNDFGVLGVAPGAKLVPVKVLSDSGSGTYEGIAEAIRYVADLEDFPHKKIISMSLGGSRGAPVLEEAINYAISKGVFIVAAAGNSGYYGKDTVNYPGAYPQVITVASIGPSGSPSSFSSGGKAVDVTAPGENVYSTHKGQGYVKMSGTSMATPHVAGLLALIVSHFENIKTQADLEKFLRDKAKDIEEPGHDPRTGSGLPIATLYIGGQEFSFFV